MAKLYAGLFVCPHCKMPWRSLRPIPLLAIPDRETIAKGDWRVHVLCTACNHLSSCSSKDFPPPNTPDTVLQRQSNYARRIFSALLKCLSTDCESPLKVFALSNGAFEVGSISRELHRCTPVDELLCLEGQPIQLPVSPDYVAVIFEEDDLPSF
jgi:hypothetical protein